MHSPWKKWGRRFLSLAMLASTACGTPEVRTPAPEQRVTTGRIQPGEFEAFEASLQRNPVTGAISLTPQALVDGALQPAPEVLPYTSLGALLTIGEFSRMTHLSVKALRHYDDVGLLSPAHHTGPEVAS